MARILILGGYGFTGALLARHLLAQSGAEIVLAGRNLEKAGRYAGQLNAAFEGGRVSAVRADAADAQSLAAALRDTDFLLVAAPAARHARTVARAALDAGVDYLDVQFSADKLAVLRSLAPEIKRAGRCFITEAGFHPGLAAALVRYAALHLDRLDTAVICSYLNMGKSLPYSEALDELMEVFRDYQGQVFRHGRWTKPRSYAMRNVDFGGEIGVRRCFSMFLEELKDLPGTYPDLQEVGFYMAGTHWFVDWVISPLAMALLKVAPRRSVRPMGRLVWWGMKTFPGPPHAVVVQIEAGGGHNGRPAVFEAAVSHPDGYELTAIPVVACLLQYLDGSIRRPGLWMMGHLAEPERLLGDMRRMGVQVRTAVRP